MLSFRSRVRAAFLGLALVGSYAGSVQGATLLPNGMQYFADDNGLPLSAACVYFYIPGTLSPKATYQNAAQTIANTNPVQLDAAGRAIIYGTGTYRQIVRASNGTITPCSPAGTQIWDQLTASTDSSATIFAGASAGTPNAITVTAPGFSGTDGQVINYISTNTNTAAATFNPSGFGAVPIVRDSATGPEALTGGELVATNAVSLIYDATAGTFHILSPVTWPNVGGVPVGTIIPVAGFTAPSGYAFTYGQAVSRTTFASLLAALTNGQTGTIASGSPIITGLSDTAQFGRGMAVESVGIPGGTTLLSCTSTTCTMNANATVSRSGTMTFFAYGAGDGSTTFNLPNLNGRGLVGRDNTGGTASNVSQITADLTTTAASASATVSSAAGLAVGMSVVGNTNVADGTTISSLGPGTTVTLSTPATGTQSSVSTRFSVFPDAQGLGIVAGSPTQTMLLAQVPTGITSAGTNSISVLSTNYLLGNTTTNTGSALGGGTQLTASDPGSGAVIIKQTSTGSNAIAVTSNNTGGQPHPIISPSAIVNWAVRLVP